MSGVLYGIGVGPGDPELMTLKAVRLIQQCQIVAVPGEEPKKSVAYKIAAGAVGHEFSDKTIGIPMPMTKDTKVLEEKHKEAAAAICHLLDEGKDVAYLTLGDPSIYSTYTYIHKQIKELGYETQMVSGVTSFAAAAARVGEPLVENRQMLHIIPASYTIEKELEYPGTKVLMKAGTKLSDVKELLAEYPQQITMVERCGMSEEQVYYHVDEIPDEASYYSLLIVKEGEDDI